jgi:hypothetical protein
MASSPSRDPLRRPPYLLFAALIVLAVALGARWRATPWGMPYLYHWDEPSYSTFAFRMVETGDLNPRFFNYPTFPTYLYALTDWIYLRSGGSPGPFPPGSPQWHASQEDKWNVPQTRLALLHRRLSAVVGALTCLLVVVLGARWGQPASGVFGALLIAVSPFLVEETAHAAVDPWVALFTLAAMVPLAAPEPSRRSILASAVLAGVATACKYNAVLSLLPALWLAGRGASDPWRQRARLAAIAFGTFVLCTPFVLLDARTAARHILYELHHYALHGHEGAEYGRGFGNLAYHWGFITSGQALGPVGWLAIPGALWLWARKRESRAGLAFAAGYLAFMSLQRTVFARNMDLVMSFVALCAFVPLEALVRARRGLAAKSVLAALALAVAGLALWDRSVAFREASRRWPLPDSRTAAMRLVAERAPGAFGAVAQELHVHAEDLAPRGDTWAVAEADTLVRWMREARLGWALLPAATDSALAAEGVDSLPAPALGAAAPLLVRAARFGNRPLDKGPPETPALVVWLPRGR